MQTEQQNNDHMIATYLTLRTVPLPSISAYNYQEIASLRSQ